MEPSAFAEFRPDSSGIYLVIPHEDTNRRAIRESGEISARIRIPIRHGFIWDCILVHFLREKTTGLAQELGAQGQEISVCIGTHELENSIETNTIGQALVNIPSAQERQHDRLQYRSRNLPPSTCFPTEQGVVSQLGFRKKKTFTLTDQNHFWQVNRNAHPTCRCARLAITGLGNTGARPEAPQTQIVVELFRQQQYIAPRWSRGVSHESTTPQGL
ncbi:hypothetical protein QBC40DRAFT_82043 [Triangularia verruculosa]|uniref:Uncharacterized protein n=1 Tax=Triangularia verruculosa TaxID=2587418 RepID=A0AAN6XF52_9PEZI|nr:hypothetical protein QBC40DRAFT_82043 [Triangularia verruculosa]